MRDVEKPPTTFTPVRAAELKSTYYYKTNKRLATNIGAIAESDFKKQNENSSPVRKVEKPPCTTITPVRAAELKSTYNIKI